MKKREIQIPEHTIIKERYKIRNIIGSGGIGTTYKTEDTESGTIVVLKALNLEQLESIKELELFEREIETLKKIKHQAIPECYDHFTYTYNETSLYILVQEFIDGENLYDIVKNGHSFSETDITAILKDLLMILSYIHSLKPPVIHRDINPKNIILDKAEMLYLVDFGAVGRGRKEEIRKLKEKKQQKKAENKDKRESDNFPLRTKIIEHSDSLELVIKPYPFWRLFKKLFGLFRGWEFVNTFILTYAAPIIVWIGIISLLWDLIDVFELDNSVVILLRIAAVFFVIGLVGFCFFLVYTLYTRHKYFGTLNIRVSKEGVCAFYHVKPDKPYYVGSVGGISLTIITPGNTLPAGKGKESKNWADIQIKVPEKDYEFYHTGFSTRDISVLQSFLSKTGNLRKKPGKRK